MNQHYVYYQDGKERCSCDKVYGHYEDGRMYGSFMPKSGPSIQNPMNNGPKLFVEPNPQHMKKCHTCGHLADARYFHECQFKEEKKENPNKTISRQGILETASNLTSGDRNKSYGEPIENMTAFADLCEVYFRSCRSTDALDAVDGAVIMALSKIARIGMSRGHVDNYVDGAAYMAIAGECDQILKERGDYAS